MSYHDRTINTTSSRTTNNASQTSVYKPSSKLIYDENGKQLCQCADGNTYENCGGNCECCNNIIVRQIDYNVVGKRVGIKKFTTTSCPCSSYAITNQFGDIECEMELAGLRQRLKAVVLKNHAINNKQPRVRDTWDCGNNTQIPCGQDWQSLHIVQVDVNDSSTIVAKINSKSSNLSCYIPKTTLASYGTDEINTSNTQYNLSPEIESELEDPDDTFNGVSLFKDKDQARFDGYFKGVGGGNNITTSEFLNDDGVTMYFPGDYYPNKKLITSVLVGGHDALAKNIKDNWDYQSYSSQTGNLEVVASGIVLQIKIKGKNNPKADITIKNSSGRSILKRKLQAVEINGEYILSQKIPGLSASKTQETYHVEITPSADAGYYAEKYIEGGKSRLIKTGVLKYTIWQFSGTKITVANSASTISNTTTTTNSTSLTGVVNTKASEDVEFTQSVTLSRSSGSHNFYIKKGLGIKDLINDQLIERTLNNKSNEECFGQFDLYTGGTSANIAKEIVVGMTFTGTVSKEITITKSIDLDDDAIDDCLESEIIEIITNKFETHNTSDLIEGMKVSGINQDGLEFESIINSIDCENSFTLSEHHSISKNTILSAKFSAGGEVLAISENKITCNNACFKLPHKTPLVFKKTNHPEISGNISFDKSGSSSITITNTINKIKFGQGDYTYTFDPDLFVTDTPSAYDQRIETIEGQAIQINFIRLDTDYNKIYKTLTITKQPNIGSLGQLKVPHAFVQTYSPPAGFTGNDTIKFTLADDNDTASEEKTIFITIK